MTILVFDSGFDDALRASQGAAVHRGEWRQRNGKSGDVLDTNAGAEGTSQKIE